LDRNEEKRLSLARGFPGLRKEAYEDDSSNASNSDYDDFGGMHVVSSHNRHPRHSDQERKSDEDERERDRLRRDAGGAGAGGGDDDDDEDDSDDSTLTDSSGDIDSLPETVRLPHLLEFKEFIHSITRLRLLWWFQHQGGTRQNPTVGPSMHSSNKELVNMILNRNMDAQSIAAWRAIWKKIKESDFAYHFDFSVNRALYLKFGQVPGEVKLSQEEFMVCVCVCVCVCDRGIEREKERERERERER